MSEKQTPKIEKEHIHIPDLEPGGTAIVLQRHERYNRDRDAADAGSLTPEAASAAYERNLELFRDLLKSEEGAEPEEGAETMFFFVSSDTQYAGGGRRSLETGQLAQDAAVAVMEELGINPTDRIINFNDDFRTRRSEATDQDINPVRHLREPRIFEKPEYVSFLRDKYGAEDGPGTGISPRAWAMHEMDAEKDVREQHGAEGVHDVVDRTKKSIRLLDRYSGAFHKANPNKRLVVWATTHYDTISPLVKDATETGFDEYVPVDYGAGVVLNIPPKSDEVLLQLDDRSIPLNLGRAGLKETVIPPAEQEN